MTTQVEEAVARRPLGETLRQALTDIGRAWNIRISAMLAAAVALGLLPVVVGSHFFDRAGALILYFALAAVGLNFIVGLLDIPSIGHGAFVALGALAMALLRTKASWSTEPALLGSIAITCLGATIVGAGAIRLRPIVAAVASWFGAWLMIVALQSFPSVTGGAEGIVVDEGRLHLGFSGIAPRLTPLWHFEVGVLLVGIALIAYRSLSTGAAGLSLAAARQNPKAAVALGASRGRLRLGVFVLGAALGGLAGALGVQLSGVFDPAAYGILLSISLFIAVLLGGPGTIFGPLAGALLLALLPLGGRPLVHLFEISPGLAGILPGPLLLVAVWIRSRRRPIEKAPAGHQRVVRIANRRPVVRGRPETLEAAGLTKRFGGVRALNGVDIRLTPGVIHGVMGPNGSGKSTLLRILAGEVAPDDGSISLGTQDITDLDIGRRARLGIARSAQGIELWPELTPHEHFLAALLIEHRHAGLFRTLLRTPLNRTDQRQAEKVVEELLDRFGLSDVATRPVGSISAGDQRILMVALAATHRRVILLDEPTAGMGILGARWLARTLDELKQQGATLLVVEHNLRLLGRIADVITVLDGGEVIAHDTPLAIYAHPKVREAYLGTHL